MFWEGVWSMDLVVAGVVAFTVGRAVYVRVTRRRARPVRAPIRHAARAEEGASAVEYGLLAAAIAAVIAGTVFLLGQTVSAAFSKTDSQVGACVQDPGQCPTTAPPPGGGAGPVPGQ